MSVRKLQFTMKKKNGPSCGTCELFFEVLGLCWLWVRRRSDLEHLLDIQHMDQTHYLKIEKHPCDHNLIFWRGGEEAFLCHL